MARDGSGTMSIPYPDFVAGTTISSSQVDANNTTIVNELTNSLPRDGQASPTANLPMGNFKLTGLPAGTSATDSLNLGQAQTQAYIWCGTAGGTKNALTLTPSPVITAYAAGQIFRFKSGATQSDSTVTVAVSGLATKAIQNNGAALSATIYLEASKWYEALYDGTDFQISKFSSPDGKNQVVGALTATSINFGGTSLANYVEGTWTPADNSGAGLSFTGVSATYTRIGNIVIATCSFNYPATASGANASISGLPISGGGGGQKGGTVIYTTAATLSYVLITAGGGAGTTANLYNSSGAAITNAALSTTAVYLQFIYHI